MLYEADLAVPGRSRAPVSRRWPDCAGQQFCLDGLCFDTAHAPDPDFARAVTGLEVQREAGSYLDPDSLDVFQGYDNRCRRKLFGLVNCCKGGGTGGSLFSDMRLIAGAGGELMGAVGSSYTYDALFASDAPDLVIAGFEALFGAGGGSSALAGLMAGDLSVVPSSKRWCRAPGRWPCWRSSSRVCCRAIRPSRCWR